MNDANVNNGTAQRTIQSNLNGSNIFGTMEIRSGHE